MVSTDSTVNGVNTGTWIWAHIRLVHPLPVLIVMCAAFVFSMLATSGQPDAVRLVLVLLALLGGQIVIGALNEYRDRALDARTKPDRPIPSGLVLPNAAVALVLVGLVLLIVGGAFLGWLPLVIAIVGTGSGIVYDLWLKNTVLSWLPYLVGLPLLPMWIWICLAQAEPWQFLLYPLGAPVVVAVHLAQSLPDIESDRSQNVYGLAARLGPDRAFWAICLMTSLAAVEVVAFGTVRGSHIIAVLLPGGMSLISIATAVVYRGRSPSEVDQNLFAIVATLAVILGIGLALSIGL